MVALRSLGIVFCSTLAIAACDGGGPSPAYQYQTAIESGDVERVRALVAEGADIEASGEALETPLILASRAGNAEIVRLLIAGSAQVDAQNADGVTPLLIAAGDGHLEVVNALLEAGADPNLASRDGDFPLVAAATSGHADVVSALLAAGADVNAGNKGLTALRMAENAPHPEVVALLQQAGAR